ncbi:MAG: pilus (MSHA type) biogenesis protein MshL [Desulfobulbaceae bacterium]|nr:pilus (MSHA type) biogenesis protein MshL [Desulfobulbaceae bacterium]
MANNRVVNTATKPLRYVLMLIAIAVLASCSANKHAAKSDEHLIKDSIPRSPAWKIEQKAPPGEPQPPAFVSMTEEIVPLKTRIVDIVVRNSPLGDVLHIIANATGLNLLVDKDVPLDQPMTLSLRNATAEDALKTIFSSADCFYTITNNVLKVESVGTKVFELGHPALVNTYSMDIGGNISGAGMSGAITSGSKADPKAHDFWGSMETSLAGIMDKRDTSTTGDSKSKTVNRSSGGQPQQSITINRLTGTIMVTASRKNLEKVEQYLDNVRKVLNRQVMIEARIIEVQLSEGLNFGIDWSFLENVKELGGPLNAGFGSLNVGSTTLNAATAVAASASKFQVGITKANFQGLLTALKTQGDIKTLSNPKINVMNGHASILTVGTNTSFISKVTTTTTATAAGNSISFTPETTSVLSGMIIGIVPYISERGDITLNITPITSDLVDLKDKTFGSAGNQVTITIPTVALREMTTTVKMRDGQMVIIGGLISKKESTSEEKVPIIGDIPYLGKFFTRINNTESRSELVLLLRPHIVENE